MDIDDLDVYAGSKIYTVKEAPVGLLVLRDGTLLCKSEYKTDDSRCECTIVSTGERYYGEGDLAMCRHLVIKGTD
jgi:hypothetical protein